MRCSPVQHEVLCSELIPKFGVFLFQSSCEKDVILNILSVLTDLLSLGKEAKLWGNACGLGAEKGFSNRSGNSYLHELGQVFAR